MRWLTPLLLLSFGFVLSAEEAIRTWTDLKGRTMEARFIKFTGDKMVIKRADGRSFTVMPDLFSEVDRKYVEEMRGKVGADGKPWDKSSVIQALVGGKWRMSRKMHPLFITGISNVKELTSTEMVSLMATRHGDEQTAVFLEKAELGHGKRQMKAS